MPPVSDELDVDKSEMLGKSIIFFQPLVVARLKPFFVNLSDVKLCKECSDLGASLSVPLLLL